MQYLWIETGHTRLEQTHASKTHHSQIWSTHLWHGCLPMQLQWWHHHSHNICWQCYEFWKYKTWTFQIPSWIAQTIRNEGRGPKLGYGILAHWKLQGSNNFNRPLTIHQCSPLLIWYGWLQYHVHTTWLWKCTFSTWLSADRWGEVWDVHHTLLGTHQCTYMDHSCIATWHFLHSNISHMLQCEPWTNSLEGC